MPFVNPIARLQNLDGDVCEAADYIGASNAFDEGPYEFVHVLYGETYLVEWDIEDGVWFVSGEFEDVEGSDLYCGTDSVQDYLGDVDEVIADVMGQGRRVLISTDA